MPKNNGLTLKKVLFHLSNGRSCDQMVKVIRLSQEFHGKKQFTKPECRERLQLQKLHSQDFFLNFIEIMIRTPMA
ncbi:hypothetical protein GCM10010967_21460 [Dyadobacter beijingensis]|uniref:Uncharacterized protein n=1 Tax=Dyadobacter beijingensis TaxID=365489 RepID=A0ABQ2HS87_9BACT|nr:hypothetical protein GCM10010967_21460 [Dyadobacter beijingensis]